MTVHAGDTALYTPRRGESVRVLVHGFTAKRARVIVAQPTAIGPSYSVRYVSPTRLERVGGGY
jgi:hypothetical protein